MKNILRKIPLVSAFFVSLLLAACGGGGGGSSNPQPQGTVRVSLTDAPACGFDQVNVTVSKVRVHQSSSASENDAGWSDITLNPARKIDLLSLANGVLLDLGQTPLPAGHYTQLRLVLVPNTGNTLANSVVPSGGTETALATPSGVQSGIKLIKQFDVAANQLVDLVLDFDACKSVKVVSQGNGGYSLRPVITVIPKVVSGGITGFVDPALAGSKPVVTAQLNGVVVKSTVPDSTTGAFTLSPLIQSSSSGNYDVVITADGRATAVVAGVPVTAGANTAVSGNGGTTPPITLPASTMRSVSGTVLPVTAEGTVRATQSLAPAGPTEVTVASKAADLSTGFYSLSLPIAAPLLGQYGSGTLPIALTSVLTAAGKYTVEASAAGFTTQQQSVDITTSNRVIDFTLVP